MVYKVVTALRFEASELYKNEIALLTASLSENSEECKIEVLKLQNLVEKGSLTETVRAGTSLSSTKLIDFLRGQQIFVWDEKSTASLLAQVFGNGAEFNFLDIRPEVAKLIPSMANASLSLLKSKSKLARYNPSQNSEINAFYNIFVTFMNAQLARQFPQNEKANERDLQLVALAALADIMPLKNENRIFIRHGVESMNKGRARDGLKELLSMQNLLGKRITATDLSWNINPALNATGRLGQPEIGLELFLEKDPSKRTEIAQKIIEMNNRRKELGNEGWNFAASQAKQSIEKYGGKLCVIIDDSGEQKINRGVSGTIAGKLVNIYDIPAMAITFVDENAIGSMRSCRGFEVLSLLDKMADLFVSYGGHAYAAGFTFKKERLHEFLAALD